MLSQIICKLQRELSKNVVDEVQVVYVMVQLRKLMVQVNGKMEFPWLKLFCDWTVHPEIHHKHEAAEGLLRNFDEMVERESKQKGFTLEFLDYLSLSHLRDELRFLFCRYNLPSSVTDANQEWDQFLEHLSSAVSDCPIQYKASGTSTKFVKRLTLTKELPRDDYVVTLIEPSKLWMNSKVELNDGSSRDWPFYN